MATRIGDAGGDNLAGTSGNDTILGLQRGGTLQGLGGSDLLVGGTGDDSVTYGSGASDSGSNLIYGDEGADTITSAGNAGNNTILGGTGNAATDSQAGVGDGNDVIDASADTGDDLVFGNFGDDAVTVGGGKSTVFGGMGNDLITAGTGGDLLFGGEGADTITVGDGNDTIVGGTGDASMDSQDGADLIRSGSGADLILGNGGDDTIASGAGDDTAVGGYGNDVILGNQGDDIILGNQGDDTLFGGMGDDTLAGGQGNDLLVGGEGNDLIIGGEGVDTVAFSGTRNSYTVTTDSQGDFIVAGAIGTATVSSTELFQFSDGTIDAGSLLQDTSSGTGTPPAPPRQADLAVTTAVSDPTPNIGDQITITGTLTNNGPNAATGVTATDLLPAGLTLVSATPSAGTYDAATGVWTAGMAASGATDMLTVVATVTSPSQQINTLSVTHSDQSDPNAANNSASATETPIDGWIDASGGNWNTAADWSGGTPTAATDAVIGVSGRYTVQVTDAEQANTLTIDDADATLLDEAGGSLTLGGALSIAAGTFDLAGGMLAANSIAISNGAQLEGAGALSASVDNEGTVVALGGTLNLAGGLTGSGVLEIGAGATLELASGDNQPAVFTAGTGTLKLDAPATFSATISGFGDAGDAVDLMTVGFSGETATWNQGPDGVGTLTLSHGATTDASLTLQGSYRTADFALESDGAGGTDVVLTDRWIGSPAADELDGDWNTAADWTRGAPGPQTCAVIDASGTYTVTVDDREAAASLTLDSADATLLDAAGGALSLSGQLAIEAGTVDLAGGTVTAASVAASDGALLEAAGTLAMPIDNAGLIAALDGTLALTGALSGTGRLSVGSGAALELASGNSQAVTFAAGTGTLRLDAPETFTSTIAGISGSDDVLDLIGFDASGAGGAMRTTATTGAGSFDTATGITTLTVSDPSLDKSETFKLVGDYSSSTWSVTSDGHGGIDVVDPPAPPNEGHLASNEVFHFHPGSVQDFVSVLESKRGQAALYEVAHDFGSLAAVIAATHPSSDGHSTILGLPNGDIVTLAGLSEKQIKADAKQIGHMLLG